MSSIESVILKHILHDEDFARKALPFLKEEYFHTAGERLVYSEINKFMLAFNSRPTREALHIELEKRTGLGEVEHANALKVIDELNKPEPVDKDWLVLNTESFCQEKAVYNAIMESIKILDGKEKGTDKNAIPSILTEALAVSFDAHIGHDFLEDSDLRYEFYHRVEEKIPFDIEYFNKITRGGLSRKSLNIILAGTGVGKSLAMCHMAAANMVLGKNVLYITLEMAEEKIAERIDANLLNTPIDQLSFLSKEVYDSKVGRVRAKTSGKLIVKEYPTASAHVGHFRHLINELNLKRSFRPDIIYVDYLNICMSARIKQGSNVNSYSYIKAIAEEIRGLAVEKNVPIVSATQTTRSGFGNSDPGLEDTSESFGLPATADFMVALVSTEELQDLNQIMVKQLKNRYADPSINRRFVVGVDKPKMRLYDVEESAQKGIMNEGKSSADEEDVSVMDKSRFGERDKEDSQMRWKTKKMGRKDFSGLKT